MNLLFEIPDSVLIVIGIIIVLIIAIAAIVIKASTRKIKPIDENNRYDSDKLDIQEDFDEEYDEEYDEEISTDQQKAKDELRKVFNQMSADLEKQKEEVDDIDEFEREQEENAIISYQELVAHAEKLKEEASKYEKIAESKADTKMKDAIKSINKKEKRNIEEEREAKKKAFRSSEIVSPIYGIQSNKNMVRQKKSTKSQNGGIIGKAYEQKRFEKEETQNLDFLNSLKEFRKNL